MGDKGFNYGWAFTSNVKFRSLFLLCNNGVTTWGVWMSAGMDKPATATHAETQLSWA